MVSEPLGRAGVLCPAVLVARLSTRVRNRSFEIDLLAAQVTFGAVAVHPVIVREVLRLDVEFVECAGRESNQHFLAVGLVPLPGV